MAAIAYDSLEYTRELEASGVPREQAEVHAKAMTARFLHNFDALVTTDYLNSRLSESDARMDKRFVESEVRMDKRFVESDTIRDTRFATIDLKLEGIKGQFNLIYWMLAVSIASTVIPAVQGLYSSL